MLQLFDALSIFDWISPLINTVRDIHHGITDGEPTSVIWLQKFEIAWASRVLGENGIDTISEVAMAMDSEGGIIVRDSDYANAINILDAAGVATW